MHCTGFGTALVLENMRRHGYCPQIIAIAGGITKSELGLQMHADVCNLPFQLTRCGRGVLWWYPSGVAVHVCFFHKCMSSQLACMRAWEHSYGWPLHVNRLHELYRDPSDCLLVPSCGEVI